MAIELHHLNTHGMMEQAVNVLDGIVRLKGVVETYNATRRSVQHAVHRERMEVFFGDT